VNIADNPILTVEQKSLLRSFSNSDLRFSFYLTGGTSLSAFYLFHRLSDDLDFFSEEPIDIEPVLAFLKSVPEVVHVQYERKFDRKIFLLRYVNDHLLKVEFTTYPFRRCEEGPVVEGIGIDSLKDILVNKIMAVSDRRDPKDFVDLYFALKSRTDLDIDDLVQATESKFGVKGVKYVLRGRFMEPLLPVGTLLMKQELDVEELSRFFKSLAMTWIRLEIRKEL
jgi:predicted nucleotidyltransferase component of viral defense system